MCGGCHRDRTAGVEGGHGTFGRDADFPLPGPSPPPTLTRSERGRRPGPRLWLGLGPVPRRRRRRRWGWRRRRRRENHRSWTRGAWRGRPRGCALPGTPRARPRRRLALRFCHSALGGGGGHLGSGARGAAASGESSGAPRAATSERALLRPSGRTQGDLMSAECLERNALGAEDSISTLPGAAPSLGPSCHPPLAAATLQDIHISTAKKDSSHTHSPQYKHSELEF